MKLAIFSATKKFILMDVISELMLCQKEVYGILATPSKRSLSEMKIQ
jgi:hypothetical protein